VVRNGLQVGQVGGGGCVRSNMRCVRPDPNVEQIWDRKWVEHGQLVYLGSPAKSTFTHFLSMRTRLDTLHPFR
jgi:hypothetical protein